MHKKPLGRHKVPPPPPPGQIRLNFGVKLAPNRRHPSCEWRLRTDKFIYLFLLQMFAQSSFLRSSVSQSFEAIEHLEKFFDESLCFRFPKWAL